MYKEEHLMNFILVFDIYLYAKYISLFPISVCGVCYVGLLEARVAAEQKDFC